MNSRDLGCENDVASKNPVVGSRLARSVSPHRYTCRQGEASLTVTYSVSLFSVLPHEAAWAATLYCRCTRPVIRTRRTPRIVL